MDRRWSTQASHTRVSKAFILFLLPLLQLATTAPCFLHNTNVRKESQFTFFMLEQTLLQSVRLDEEGKETSDTGKGSGDASGSSGTSEGGGRGRGAVGSRAGLGLTVRDLEILLEYENKTSTEQKLTTETAPVAAAAVELGAAAAVELGTKEAMVEGSGAL